MAGDVEIRWMLVGNYPISMALHAVKALESGMDVVFRVKINYLLGLGISYILYFLLESQCLGDLSTKVLWHQMLSFGHLNHVSRTLKPDPGDV